MRGYRDELISAPGPAFAPGMCDPRARLSAMFGAWLGHIERHPDVARLLFAPIKGDSEAERVQRDPHARQRTTRMALLAGVGSRVCGRRGGAAWGGYQVCLAAVAMWWLDHPMFPREVSARALLYLTEGVAGALGRPEDGGGE